MRSLLLQSQGHRWVGGSGSRDLCLLGGNCMNWGADHSRWLDTEKSLIWEMGLGHARLPTELGLGFLYKSHPANGIEAEKTRLCMVQGIQGTFWALPANGKRGPEAR